MFSMFFRNLLVMFFLTNSAHTVQIAPLREREKKTPSDYTSHQSWMSGVIIYGFAYCP